MKAAKSNPIDRIIDANINRAKEGLRVCEEIVRFILNSRALTQDFKKVRHQISLEIKRVAKNSDLIAERYSLKDVGLGIILKDEFKRKDYRDIFFANIQRVKESVRVLEEFSKLKSSLAASGFKRIRYKIYEIEKRVVKEI